MRLFEVTLAGSIALALCSNIAYGATTPANGDVPEQVTARERPMPKPRVNGAARAHSIPGLIDSRKNVFDDPLTGVVVNRTITVLGKDFYQYFTARWREKDVGSKFTISIHERPSARFGSEIWVQFRQKRMFHTFLPPARAATKKIGAMAVETVYQNINNSEVERIMVKSPDLGPEEM